MRLATGLTLAVMLLLAAGASAGEVEYWKVPDPTADDGVCKIYTLGHSFFMGADDLIGLLPRMLKHQKGWEVKMGGRWSQGGWGSKQVLIDEGYHSVDDFRHTKDIEGWKEIKKALADEMAKPDGHGGWDLILFLNGTGGPGSEINNHGEGMMHERNYARAMHAIDPSATLIGLAVWAPPTSDYKEFAAECDLNLHAWRGAAGVESEAQIIWDIAHREKRPHWHTLKKLWDQAGNIDRFVAAPVAEAWKIAYAEKGIGNIVLHRSIVNRDPHGNLWGDYLKTCVFFSMITGEKFDGRGFTEQISSPGHKRAAPEENKTDLPDDIARYLEDVAWRTVQRDRVVMTNLLNGRPAGVPKIKPATNVTRKTIRRTYDSQGRVVRIEMPGDKIIRKLSYHPDGSLARREKIGPDNAVMEVRTFEPIGREGTITAITHKDAEGDILGRDVFTYHPNGRKASEKFVDAQGGVDATYTFEYSDGRLHKRSFYNAAGQLESVTTFAYDRHGRVSGTTETHVQTGESETLHRRYAGDKPDAPLVEIRGDQTVTRHIYDARGHVVRTAVYRVDPPTGARALISETIYRNTYPQ